MNDLSHNQRLQTSLDNARRTLLSLRNSRGHWEGELASSALSTATAVCVFAKLANAGDVVPSCDSNSAARLAHAGRGWLAANQNADGGWGDTTDSLSNISTTALCWCAFAGTDGRYQSTVASAEDWLRRAAGSLQPEQLVRAIKQRYGRDHTFSVPILTTMALHGRLGEEQQAWRAVPQLPFELAAFPRNWFAALRLPVVSYALPALIAIGLVRHTKHPTRNPVTRPLRNSVRSRVLSVLSSIQPTSGGFLEATPLTSFVTLALLESISANHPVIQRGVQFLQESCRPDGSWPIDTNLATWVSTLAVNALRCGDDRSTIALAADDQQAIGHWLLQQQYKTKHPYTSAAPGGWAWTDLPGGVPDADDTPGALLALKSLRPNDAETKTSATAGVRWLLDLQNRDGGIPTFCRGWGTLPFDRSSCDITAHGLRAWLAWRSELPPAVQQRIDVAIPKALAFLARNQRRDGAWPPLWFGNQHATAEDETNLTYGTSRVILALCELQTCGALSAAGAPDLPRALSWLTDAQNSDGGWGGVPGVPSSIEETAFAVEALATAAEVGGLDEVEETLARGVDWLIESTTEGTHFPTTPVGFYFAKLWYHEQLYPIVHTVAALGRTARIFQAQRLQSVVETTG